jgi:4-hydroxy-tetrahydrodipicolinate synthase
MQNPLFKGCGVALVTPFSAEGVNEAVLRELVEFHVSAGTDALVVCGSTGEASTMSAAEQGVAIRTAVEASAGRLPVVAGVGGMDTAAVAELARTARAMGADALLASTPPYNKPTQQGMVLHFRRVMDAGDLPTILYNVPGRTASNLLPETVEVLAEDPRVVGVKEASGDISQIVELARRVSDRVALYSGNDDHVVPLLSVGGMGVISVAANMVPGAFTAMVHAYLEGRVEEARALQLRYLPLVRTLFREPNPIPVKAGVRILGFEVGDVRLPLTAATDETMRLLADAVNGLGIAAKAAR